MLRFLLLVAVTDGNRLVRLPIIAALCRACRSTYNKSAISNLARGPRRGAVAHVRPVDFYGQWARPKFAPKSTPFRAPIPKPHYLPHPWTRPTYDAKRHPDLIRRFFHNALDRQTDRQTDRQIVHGKVR